MTKELEALNEEVREASERYEIAQAKEVSVHAEHKAAQAAMYQCWDECEQAKAALIRELTGGATIKLV